MEGEVGMPVGCSERREMSRMRCKMVAAQDGTQQFQGRPHRYTIQPALVYSPSAGLDGEDVQHTMTVMIGSKCESSTGLQCFQNRRQKGAKAFEQV